jgi:hypothetical protein
MEPKCRKGKTESENRKTIEKPILNTAWVNETERVGELVISVRFAG